MKAPFSFSPPLTCASAPDAQKCFLFRILQPVPRWAVAFLLALLLVPFAEAAQPDPTPEDVFHVQDLKWAPSSLEKAHRKNDLAETAAPASSSFAAASDAPSPPTLMAEGPLSSATPAEVRRR